MQLAFVVAVCASLSQVGTSNNQDPVKILLNAKQQMSNGQHAAAASALLPLSQQYPGTMEITVLLAECYLELKRPVEVFTGSMALNDAILPLVMRDSISDQISTAKNLAAWDAIALKAIDLLERAGNPETFQALAWRAQLLHKTGLGMLSTRSTSGWGRRILAQSHAAMVDARRSTAENAMSCRRKIRWGWDIEDKNTDPQLVRLARISLPQSVIRSADDRFIAHYTTTPERSPLFTSRALLVDAAPRDSEFVDAANTYVVEWKQVYLEGNRGGADAMWGVFYTDCTVYSMSKLHNCIINQAYAGTATTTIEIDDPVFSIVVPSLDNFYHAFVETLPKILMLQIELSGKGQLPWLASLGDSLVVLAPDVPIVRKMLKFARWPSNRTRFIAPAPDTRYRINRAVTFEFGPANPGSIADPTWRPWRKVKGHAKKTWYPGPRSKGIEPRGNTDPWDGNPGPGEDEWATYRVPRAALTMIREAFVSDDQIPSYNANSIARMPTVLYASRGKSGSRTISGLGEDRLISSLRKALAGVADVVVHQGKEPIDEQVRMASNAAVLVGPHGAGLTNMMWMPKGGAVVRFPLKPEIERCFEYMAAALSLRYYEVQALTAPHMGHYELTKRKLDDVIEAVKLALESGRSQDSRSEGRDIEEL